MRIPALIVMLLAVVSCGSKKAPSTASSPERLAELGLTLRTHLKTAYPTCRFGSAVQFDGKGTYSGRAFSKQQGGEQALLMFKLDRESWSCDDANSRVPGNPPSPCADAATRCK